MKRMFRHMHRPIRAAGHLRRDERVPAWARWAFRLAGVCIVIPGPFDELAIIGIFGVVWIRHRHCVRDAWAMSKG